MKKLLLLNVLLVLLIISGCSDTEKIISDKNTFVAGQDNQYMYEDVWYGSTLQRGDGGYYFLKDNFIYFIDKDMSVYPLCNKSDCLHNKEIDEDKKHSCNAYIEGDFLPAEQVIQYYNNSIYYMDNSKIEKEGLYLKRIDLSAQQTETVYNIKAMSIDRWIIHRNYLYYALSSVTTTDEKGRERATEDCSIYSLNLEDKSVKTVADFNSKGLILQQTLNMQAYGNYVYFDCSTVKKGTGILDANNDSFNDSRYVYDIKNDEFYSLTQKVKGDTPTFCGYFKDKLIYLSGDNCIYTCNLNGENTTKLFDYDKKYNGYNIFSDGNYIIFEEIEKAPGVYILFDKKGELINKVKMPFIVDPQLPYDDEYIIRLTEDDKLQAVSKKDIATKKKLTSKIIYEFS